jgi:hypothetical protein
MRARIFFIAILVSGYTLAQSPTRILRYAGATTVFGENLSAGVILIDVGANKTYLTLVPLTAEKSISSCGGAEIKILSDPWGTNGNDLYYTTGNIGVGTTTPEQSAAFEISSTTQGFLPTRMTQEQRNLIAPAEGLIIYNTTSQRPNYYDGSEWRNFDGTSANLVVAPTLSTTAVSSLAPPTATSGGNISYNGGAVITARGVCWGTSPNPTTASSYTTDGTGNGSFTSSVTGLSDGTTYYLRAYATNSAGTSYGNEITFVH